MKLNARKFATWLIALLLVSLLYQLVIDGEQVLASSFGVGVLLVGMVFRRSIFRLFHHHVEQAVDRQASKLFAGEPEEREAFDVDAAFANYMANRDDMTPPTSDPVPPAPCRASGFGRKGL